MSVSVGLQREPLKIEALLAEGGNAGFGAEVVFAGVVRNFNHGKRVLSMSYDALEPLAETVLREISEEAVTRFGPALEVIVRHRVGRLQVGEASVVIVTRAPHRAEAYAASRYVIDELKHRVPIWKQENYEGGQSQWLRGHALCQSPS